MNTSEAVGHVAIYSSCAFLAFYFDIIGLIIGGLLFAIWSCNH